MIRKWLGIQSLSKKLNDESDKLTRFKRQTQADLADLNYISATKANQTQVNELIQEISNIKKSVFDIGQRLGLPTKIIQEIFSKNNIALTDENKHEIRSSQKA